MNVTREEYAALGARRRGGVKPAAPQKKRRVTRKERDIQRAILDAAKWWKGVRLWKTGGGLLPLADGRRVRMGAVGVSDLVGWKTEMRDETDGSSPAPPRACFVAVECKREGRYPDQHQRAFLDAVREAGGIAIVARSVDDVRRVLQLVPPPPPSPPRAHGLTTGQVSALMFALAGLQDAIYTEGGLDGAMGAAVIARLREAFARAPELAHVPSPRPTSFATIFGAPAILGSERPTALRERDKRERSG